MLEDPDAQALHRTIEIYREDVGPVIRGVPERIRALLIAKASEHPVNLERVLAMRLGPRSSGTARRLLAALPREHGASSGNTPPRSNRMP